MGSDLNAVLARLQAVNAGATPGERTAVAEDGAMGDKYFDIWSPTWGSLAHLSEMARRQDNWRRLKGDATHIATYDVPMTAALVAVVEAAVKTTRRVDRHATDCRLICHTGQWCSKHRSHGDRCDCGADTLDAALRALVDVGNAK